MKKKRKKYSLLIKFNKFSLLYNLQKRDKEILCTKNLINKCKVQNYLIKKLTFIILNLKHILS